MQVPSATESVNKIIETIHEVAASHESMEASIGKILSPPPDIQVEWNDIILTREQIYISERILIGHQREIKGHLQSGTQDAGHHTHNHAIDNPYTATMIYTDTLKIGDLVSVIPLKDGQHFIILSKIVYLG